MSSYSHIWKMVKRGGPFFGTLLILDWFLHGWQFGPNLVSPVRMLQDPRWILAVIVGALTIVAWRLDALERRVRMGHCRKCNYDRRGLAAGVVCPECGAAPVRG